MKKRALGFFLAFSILLGNCSSSFIAVKNISAADEKNGKTAEEKLKDEKLLTGEEDKMGEDMYRINRSMYDVDIHQKRKIELYKGQDAVSFLNEKLDDRRPRYSEYFEFIYHGNEPLTDVIYEKYKVVSSNKYDVTDSLLTFGSIDEESEVLSNYNFDIVRISYIPENINVKRIIDSEKKVCLQVGGNYFISSSPEESTFKSNTIPIADKYYIRNMNKDSEDYLAISDVIYNKEIDPKLSVDDKMITSDIIFDDGTITNKDITVSYNVYAIADSIDAIIENNGKNYNAGKFYPTETLRDKGINKFVVKYTFKASQNQSLHIKNLGVIVTANNTKVEQKNIPLYDSNSKKCDDLFIDKVNPVLLYMSANTLNNNIIFSLKAKYRSSIVKDEASNIASISYSLDNGDTWEKPDEVKKFNGKNLGQELPFTIKLPVADINKKEILAKVIDEAGNVNIIKRKTDGIWIVANDIVFDSGINVSDNAIVNDIDLSKQTITNKDVTISFYVHSKANSIDVTLKNNGKNYNIGKVSPTKKGSNNEKNEFLVKYTFKVPNNESLYIKDLSATVKESDTVTVTKNLILNDSKSNKCDDLFIDKINPTLLYHNNWQIGNDTFLQLQAKYRPSTITMEASNIKSIGYSLDDGKTWHTPIDATGYNNNNYGQESWFTVKMPTSDIGTKELLVRDIDEAGNINTIKRQTNGIWLVDSSVSTEDIERIVSGIKKVELYYSEPGKDDGFDEKTSKILSNSSVLHINTFANTINKPLQLRIYAPINYDIKIGDNKMSKHNTIIDDDTKKFDYFYYNIPYGFNGEINLTFGILTGFSIPLNGMAISKVFNLEIKSDLFIVEKNKPTVSLNNPAFASENVAEKNKWYGIKEENGNLVIDIKDEDNGSGISSVYISERSKPLTANKDNPITVSTSGKNSITIKDNFITQDFSSLDEKVSDVKVTIPLKIFEDGDHNLKITVYDNAGNMQTNYASKSKKDLSEDNESFVFSTDFTRPTGNVSLVSNPKSIGGDNWFDTSKPIELMFKIDDGINGYPQKVRWKSNEEGPWNPDLNFPYNKNINTRTDTVTDVLDLTKNPEGNHSNTIFAIFYDYAGNASSNDKVVPLKIYIDDSDPVIDNVKIFNQPQAGLKKAIRILTFGLFYNDDITITVKAHDIQNDSKLGAKAMQISFDGGKTYVTMETDNKNPSDEKEFYYVLPSSKELQSGVLKFRLTDQYGHSSDIVKYIESGVDNDESKTETEDNGKNYIIEKNLPSVDINLPKSDGFEREDKEKWYNTNKDITITVSDSDSGLNGVYVYINPDENDDKADVEKDDLIDNISNNSNDDINNELGNDKNENTNIDVNGIPICIKEVIEDNTKAFKEGIDTTTHKYHISTDDITEYLKNINKEPEDGHYVIMVVAEDNAYNKRIYQKDYYIDKINPEVSNISFSIPSADDLNEGDVKQFIEQLEYGYYFKKEVTATVNVYDKVPSSGLYQLEYALVEYNNGLMGEKVFNDIIVKDNQLIEDNQYNKGTASFTIPSDFKGQIIVRSCDYVGNKSIEQTPDLFVIDTPEKHDSEEHISISGLGNTNYRDSEGHYLFDNAVNFTVKVSDTMSGIRSISYSDPSDGDPEARRTITIQNKGNNIGDDLGDGWKITAMDENLVTEVVCDYSFYEDRNNIQLFFEMTDRAKNTSEMASEIFSIDMTSPIINVAFNSPNGRGNYYGDVREATITVIERNFDSSRIQSEIRNSSGSVPYVGFEDISDTEHVARVQFREGDYTFSIDGSDRCDHNAVVNYSGGNERNFHVDTSNPAENDNFDQFINDSRNSFNTEKVMQVSINEHNFVPELVDIHVYRTEPGRELTTYNREDCTSEFYSSDKWVSNGDTHSISFKFSKDNVYQIIVNATDASGRRMAEKISPVFEIDTKAPVLKTPANFENMVYTNKNLKAAVQPIVYEDSNIDRVKYTVVSYQMKINEEMVGYDMNVNSKNFEVNGDSIVLSNDYFSQDGIYEVRCVAYDIAGNTSKESVHTYVIQRNSDFIVYIPNSNKKSQTGLYKFNAKGIRSQDFEDIEIIAYLTQDKNFKIEVDGTDVSNTFLDIVKKANVLNQIDMYTVNLKSSYISQNYDADTIDADLTLNAISTDGKTNQVITLGHIYIDNVKPAGEYESTLLNLGTFGGFYGMTSKTVIIEGVSPDIDIDHCEIKVNSKTLTNSNGGFVYDKNAHTISFIINEGYSEIRPTLIDKAGNVNTLSTIKNVYVGGLFARWWYLFILGGLLVLTIPILIIVMLVRRRRKPI